MRILLSFIVCLVFVSACSLQPVDRGEGNMLSLTPVTTDVQMRKNRNLVVGFPQSKGSLDSERIAIQIPDGRIDYFARVRWPDFLPVVVQTALTESLSRSGAYNSVLSDRSGIGNDLLLKIEIHHFEAVYPAYLENPPEVRVEMNVVLENVRTGAVERDFKVRSAHQAIENNVLSIHEAFNAAFSDVQMAIIDKLL